MKKNSESFLSFRFISTLKSRQLMRASREVNESPHDAGIVLDFMQEANKVDPLATIRLYEGGNIVVDDAIFKEYLKALVLCDRLQYVDINNLLSQKFQAKNSKNLFRKDVFSQSSYSNNDDRVIAGNDSKNIQGSSIDSNSGKGLQIQFPPEMKFRLNQKEKLQVVVAENTWGLFWGFLRSTMGILIFFAAISVFAEGLAQSLPKGFGMGGTKIQPVEDTHTTFEDVRGCEEVQDEFMEIISYLRNPSKFSSLGAKLPKGVLLSGAPGTGKTLIARAIAGEAKVPFFQASGSEFEEMFVGVGARRIRDLFAAARKNNPCIIFIDEIDAVGTKRSKHETNSARMTLNQLLVELDGFQQNEGVVVICATNFPESLDKALTRPGRLDKIVAVPLPDLQGRREILEMYGKKIKLSKDVDLDVFARRTAGMTGADLFNILNTAAVKCSADDEGSVSTHAIELAFDRVVVGLERRNPMSEEEKLLTAYHEGGHTLVTMFTKGTDPVHKATIMRRGHTLGVTWMAPDKERYSQSLSELQAKLITMMGGKAAEELIFGAGSVTTGCTSDLKEATSLARMMVMQCGMGIKDSNAPMFVENYEGRISEDYMLKVDRAVQNLLDEAYKNAYELLKLHKEELDFLAKALCEYETLNAQEIKLVIKGKVADVAAARIEAKRNNPPSSSSSSSSSGRIVETKNSVKGSTEIAVTSATTTAKGV